MTAPMKSGLLSGSLGGIALMIAASVVLIFQHSTAKWLSADLSVLEIVFFRTVTALLFFLPWIFRSGLEIFRTQRIGLHLFRAVLQTLSAFGFFIALAVAPLATVTALQFTTPIFAVLIGIVVLGERVSVRRWSAIIAGFIGTVVIIRPDAATFEWGTLLVLGSALSWAGAIIIIKTLGRTDSSVTITAYMYLLMTPITLLAALFDWAWPTLEQYGWLIAMGLSGAGAHILMAEALRRAPTHVVSPFEFFRLIWATLIGIFIFGDPPDMFVWTGGLIVMGSVSYIAWREHILAQARKAA
ncbi:MAG: DMT family transporter [Proteobacteria bacterium]|nr:DMT family transporter [Pseudomonadota bacterium]